MGIPGLKSYINEFFTGWQQKKLRGHLVVDGNNVRHYLEFEWSHGGQFNEFYEATVRFYQLLLDCGIIPIVVLDGIDHSGEKWDTIVSRICGQSRRVHDYMSSSYKKDEMRGMGIFPPLGMDVSIQALDYLGITVVTADGDADDVTVEIANYYNCPVLSNDSDFFLYRLNAGYILFDRHYIDRSNKIFHADVYYFKIFCKQFFRLENVRLLVPALVGNDCMIAVTKNQDYRKVIDDLVDLKHVKCHFIRKVMRYLHLFYSMESFMKKIALFHWLSDSEKDELRKNCKRSKDCYDSEKTLGPEHLLETSTICEKILPPWFIKSYRRGHISKFLISVIILKRYLFGIAVDDTMRECSSHVSQQIRKYIYGIIGHDTIKELFRARGDIQSEYVDALTHIAGRLIPSLAEMSSLSNEERKSCLYLVLSCQDYSFEEVEDGLKLALAATIFWSAAAQPSKKLIKSLLFCFVVCFRNSDVLRSTFRNSESFKRDHEWTENLHSFSQWQSCYKDALRLNQILMCPLAPASPAFLFDGKLVMHLAEGTNLDKAVGSLHVDISFYHKLHRIVIT